MADCIASCLHSLSPTSAPTQHHDAKIESNTLQSAQGAMLLSMAYTQKSSCTCLMIVV